MAKYLIVNADDYGMASSVSQGIRDSHERGIVTSTTVMIGMDGAAEGVQQALKETPNLGLGLHVVVAGKAMKPVLPASEIPSLVRPDGLFYDNPVWAEKAPGFNRDEMIREVNAQFDRFVQVAGQLPTHIDSHYHAAYYQEGSIEAMRALALKHNLPMRHADVSDLPVVEGIQHNAVFFQLDHHKPIEVLIDILRNLPEGEIVELCCHPGYSNDTLFNTDPWTTVREIEVAYLTDPRVKAVIEEEGITLCHFGIFKK